MAENKTKPTTASVEGFLNTVKDGQKRKDSFAILKMMKEISGEKPKMWGASLIGFGSAKLKSPATGREVDWMKIGFSPRKTAFSLYLTGNIKNHGAALKKLGKHKTGVGCLYINKLADVEVEVLKDLIKAALKAGFFGK